MSGIINENIVAYMRTALPLFDGELGRIQREALEEGLPIISPETARFLYTLLLTVQPKKVLEIGCCVGFSAGVIYRAMGRKGHITTIDRYEQMIRQAKQNFQRMDMSGSVTLLEGHATEILPQLTGVYDCIFLDAAKGQYLTMLPDCLRLLKLGGIFLVDDIFQGGRVASHRHEIPRRQRTIYTRMQKFLHAATHTPGLESSLAPIGDGLLVAVKCGEIKEIIYE